MRALCDVVVVQGENVFRQRNGASFENTDGACVIANRQDLTGVTGGGRERYIQYACFKGQHCTARNVAIAQFEDFLQHRADFALNQINFLLHGSALREFLVADHVEHLA